MNPMFKRPLVLAGLLALSALAAGSAGAAPRTVTDPQAPRALAAEGPVSVTWGDPAEFTEIRRSTNRFEAERGNWVQDIAAYLRKAATRELQPEQRLAINVLDIKRAGDYEPWQNVNARDIRYMRDIYPPRLTFTYTLSRADGSVVAEGEAKLQDTGYLHSIGLQSSTDPLRYEKKLIDDWTRRELKKLAGSP